jgi:hypothetical protein
MTTDDEFYLQVAHALSGCQLVEQELKLYISEALECVAKYVANKVPFTMNGQDYEDVPLGGLIRAFEKLSNHPQLVADLKRFTKERNFLSHRGIAHCLDPDGELDSLAAGDFAARLAAIQPEADRLRLAIREEANKFRGHLWFDPVVDEG